jgi:ParB family chromosome partitioning protein
MEQGYELVAGERRWRACQMAGIDEVPVVVREMSDAEAFATALVENIQREDLNPLEEAIAYQRLLDEFGYTQKTVSAAVGKSRSAVANSVRLLRLPSSVQAYVASGELSAGHARSLAALPADEAAELAEIMVLHGYSVREAEELVRESKEAAQKAKKPRTKKTSQFRDDAQVRRVTDELQQALGTRVKVKDRHGAGHIEIHYSDYDVLQDVLDRLLC